MKKKKILIGKQEENTKRRRENGNKETANKNRKDENDSGIRGGESINKKKIETKAYDLKGRIDKERTWKEGKTKLEGRNVQNMKVMEENEKIKIEEWIEGSKEQCET